MKEDFSPLHYEKSLNYAYLFLINMLNPHVYYIFIYSFKYKNLYSFLYIFPKIYLKKFSSTEFHPSLSIVHSQFSIYIKYFTKNKCPFSQAFIINKIFITQLSGMLHNGLFLHFYI